MKNNNFQNFSSLLHTDWHPEKGDFIKENSLNDSALFNKRLRKHTLQVISLSVLLVVLLVGAIVLFSI